MKDDERFVWSYVKENDTGHYFLNVHGGIDLVENSKVIGYIKEGEYDSYMVTDNEAKSSSFYFMLTRNKIPNVQKMYHIRLVSEDHEYLNFNTKRDEYFFGDSNENDENKTIFTEKECDEIIGTSKFVFKDLV